MESKRLGLSQKNLYVVPNHLTEQWGSDFLRLYPGANILVATKKDFEPANRKRFCSRIATGDYDAVIIGHTQFEKIPLSRERQIVMLEDQIADITFSIEEAAHQAGQNYTIRQNGQFGHDVIRIENVFHASGKTDVATGIDGRFVFPVPVDVFQGEGLNRQSGIDGAFEQIGMERQHVSLSAGRAFRKEDAAFPGLQVSDQCFQCAFEVPCTATFEKQRSGFPGQPADHGPVCHVRLGDEMAGYDRVDQENVQP